MEFSDQLILRFYDFMQTPASKIVFGVVFVFLIIWAWGATRKHAYHYAMRGAGFGATGALLTALLVIGGLVYMVVDKQAVVDIAVGRRPVSDVPVLAQDILNRFRFVLGASHSTEESPTAQEVLDQIKRLPREERERLQLQTCREVLQAFPK